ncbi:GAP family protein [Nocardia tengchongensis]|uniref:GAP family protein n=1 Tax=Nocardia tengchongensis TaxID=2055889 RepID=UPI003606A649
MLLFLLALTGFAFLDSLDVLLVGVTTAVVYDSRLSRRSPVPGALSFLAGVFAVTTVFGLTFVLGLHFLTDLVSIDITPAMRYWAELLAGIVLLVLGSLRGSKGDGAAAVPQWALEARRRPLLLGFVGVAIGLGQAPTAVPYLAALTMISARDPRPSVWPLIIVAYCLIALLPPVLVLFTSTLKTGRSRRFYRGLVRGLKRFGPLSVRVLLLVAGAALVADAVVHHARL